jgi:hypothetical protein
VSQRVRHVVIVALLVMAGTAAVAAADPQHALRVPAPEGPVPIPPEPDPAPPPSGPCGDPAQRCPDLVVFAPSELEILRTPAGRVLLGARNKLVNRGAGPLYLLGTRRNSRTMTVRQRIFAVGGGHVDHPLANTYFDLWRIPGQGSFWKLRDALRFELWTAGPFERFVKPGRKTRFCMRDLVEVPGMPGPRSRIFGACSQSRRAQTVRMGLSVGWQESYPAGYFEQYVDVTGLRGCHALRHVADPLARVLESDESNNIAQTRVLLPPPRRARVRAC